MFIKSPLAPAVGPRPRLSKSGIPLSLGLAAGLLWLSGISPASSQEVTNAVSPQPAGPPAEPFVSGEVIETMDADRYTYILVENRGKKVWVAGFKFPVKVGDKVVAPGGFMMRDFRSRSLGRTFDEILFASPIEVMPAGHPAISLPPGHPGTAPDVRPAPAEMDISGIEPPEGGLTVAAIHEQRERLSGQEVIVRGKVVKFTPSVMDRNWIHLQDGSGQDQDRHDLTVTTQEETEVGDVITVRGTIAVDRDMGFGYEYSVLVEDAVIETAPTK